MVTQQVCLGYNCHGISIMLVFWVISCDKYLFYMVGNIFYGECSNHMYSALCLNQLHYSSHLYQSFSLPRLCEIAPCCPWACLAVHSVHWNHWGLFLQVCSTKGITKVLLSHLLYMYIYRSCELIVRWTNLHMECFKYANTWGTHNTSHEIDILLTLDFCAVSNLSYKHCSRRAQVHHVYTALTLAGRGK